MRDLRRLAAVMTILLAVATVTVPDAPAATVVSSVPAAADAYVSSASPGTNRGTSTRLRADAAPTTRSYLRFDLRGLSGTVTSAKLRLQTTSGSTLGLRVHAVADRRWTETGITYANAPTPAATITASSGAFAVGAAITLDVTSLATGDELDLALTTPSATALSVASREAGAASGPQLVVETGPSDTIAPSAPAGLGAGSATQNGLTLTWSPSTDNVAVAGYRVSVDGGPATTTTATRYAVTGLACGTVHGFAVRAFDTTGNVSAAASTSGTTAPCAAPAGIAFPARAAFYYPWFPETWSVNGAHVAYRPALGYYSSSDASVQQAHIRALDYAHVQVAISSWWGASHYTNDRLAQLLNRTVAMGSPLKWAVYYEPEGNQNPSVTQIAADLAAIRDHLATSPAFAKVNGRFVVFVYNANDTTCAVADRWRQADESLGSPAYVVLKVFPGYATCASQPSGWHQYAPAGATDRQPSYSFSISPGFWRADEPAARLGRDLARFRQNVRDMVASREPWQLVTTFNEWGEGTATEAGAEWASASGFGAYLDALHSDGA